MKKFKQQQKYGHTYTVPAVEKYTVNPKTDVCVDADPELLITIEDWFQRNRIYALLIGKARRWSYERLPATVPTNIVGATLIDEKIVFRFRDTVIQSMFIMQFNGVPPHPDATLLPLDG